MSRPSKEQRVKWMLEDGCASREDFAWTIVELLEVIRNQEILLESYGIYEDTGSENL